MKLKLLISTVLTAVLFLSVIPPSPAKALAVPSEWAVSEMNDANTSGLLSARAAADFHRELSRDEFCELVVIMSERVLGRSLPIPTNNPFTDTDSVHAQKAYNYGIISGVGNSQFDPNAKIERQQLCTMVIRAIKKLENDTGRPFLIAAESSVPFYDSTQIADYAADSIKVAFANDIIKGNDENNFRPKSGTTSEECVAVVIRAFNAMQKNLAATRTPQQVADMAYNCLEIGFAHGDAEKGVTRDILLASTSAVGASIKWVSDNEDVISSAGSVYVGNTPTPVKLTATITVSGASRTKEFNLVTSTFTGDRLFVENAYSLLNIFYSREGDGPDSVTGRICLPSNILDSSVVWSTSNSSTVSRTGNVSLPSGVEERNVTLTARIYKGSESITKEFPLRITSPKYINRGISLNGVELGMEPAQVASILGSPSNSYQTAQNESWNTYHDGFKNFITVGFINNRSVAVYSMRENAESYLKDASKSAITVDQINLMDNVSAISYSTGSGTSKILYAVMIYNPSSSVANPRGIYSDGQERLLLDLINAYRLRNSKSILSWNSRLSASARSHSDDMGRNNYLSTTSRSGSTFQDRAAAQGYESKLVISGNILGGAADSVDALSLLLDSSAILNDLLSTNATVIGIGFSGGYSGQHATYLTYALGSLKAIDGVTAKPDEINLTVSSSVRVTLSPSPSGFNESIRWSSSNNSIFVLTGTEGTNTPTVEARAVGSANIIVTGATSGNSFTIPVVVETTPATGLELKLGNDTLSDDDSAFLAAGESLQLSAVTTPATGVAVSWSSNNPSVATVNSSGLVTAKTGVVGTVTISASTQGESSTQITKHVIIRVDSLTLSGINGVLNPGDSISLVRDDQTKKSEIITASLLDSNYVSIYNFEFTERVAGVITSSINNNKSIITAANHGSTTIDITITRKDTTYGRVERSIPVSVIIAEYPTNLALDPSGDIEIQVGERMKIEATITPIIVEKNTITWKSESTSIATVDSSGNVLGVGKGETIITATIIRKNGPLIVPVKVKVIERKIPITGIAVKGDANVTVSKDIVKYEVTKTPNNANDDVILWKITPVGTTPANSATINQENGEAKFTQAGKVIITAYLKDNPAIYGSLTVTITEDTSEDT